MNRDQATFHDSIEVQENSYCYFPARSLGHSEAITSTHHNNQEEAMYTTQSGVHNDSGMMMPIPWPQPAYYGHQHQQLSLNTLEESLEEKEMQQYPALDNFDAIVQGYLNNLSMKKRDKALVDRHRYSIIAKVLKDPRNTAISTAQFRFWVKKMFQLVSLQDGTDVVCHDSKPVAMREDIYAILVQAHKQANHGGRDKTSALARRRYSWIPKELIARFVRHCPYCIARRIGSQSPPFGLLPRIPPDETATRDNTQQQQQQQPLGDQSYLSVDIKPILGDSNLGLDWTDQSTSCYIPSSPSTTSPSSSVSGPPLATSIPSCTTAPPSSLGTADAAYQQHVLLSPCGIPASNWSPSDGQHVDDHHRPSSSSFTMCYSTSSSDASGNMSMSTTPPQAYHHLPQEPHSSKTTYGHGHSIATEYYYGAIHQEHHKHQQLTGHFMDRISETVRQANAVDPFESSPLSPPPTTTFLAEYSETHRPRPAVTSTTTYLDHSSPTSAILEDQCQL